MQKSYYAYILASQYNGTLYIGVTSNISLRVWQHKGGEIDGFTKKYGVTMLVYYEEYNDIRDAITREKQLKKWKRRWKLTLINTMNPEWKDLYEEF